MSPILPAHDSHVATLHESALSERPAIVHSAALVRRASASASGVHSRRSSVRLFESAYDTRSRSCRRCV